MFLEAIFSEVVQLLLWPVLLLLAAFFLYALWAAGAVVMEWAQRRANPAFASVPQDVSLDELELWIVRQLEPLRLVSRLAPMLGLIATMIPLGPALQSVAGGEGQAALAVFSSAFSGVVLALAAASIALVLYSVRRRWLLAELVQERAKRGEGAA